ncbi:hypothetical protein AC244_16215 [Ensifer adhaerens]|uniref:Nucleoid-associated protein n=1 Tax=Ensifer adhaerens TaxID=106592 RepID=A0A0L8BTJ7_ENSAD|nr:nucleoid-associated protein [Ensifer adhaerens]KOF17903.1 hypothetical protein AC244_16215 [Ensifer adhaerens]
MSFLTDHELNTVEVSKMILHVVGRAEEPFSPQPQIEVQQEAFFRERIFAAAAAGVHRFKEDSYVRPIIERMARNELTFEQGGQQLSQLFYRDHVRQSSSGAFFVFELRNDDPNVILYALVKYDYREAVELAQQDGRNVLRAIIQAFVKEKKALQKFSIVRVREGAAEEQLSASDRMKEAPDLTDYFERYLGVERSRSTEELSRKLNEAIRGALQELKDNLPDKNVGAAVARAKSALQARDMVTNDDVVDAVLHAADRPDDESVRLNIEKVMRRKLKSVDLTDVDFRPDPQTLRLQPRRYIRTAEQVRIEFPGEEQGRSVMRRELPEGGVEFTIRTNAPLVEDKTLAERPRD